MSADAPRSEEPLSLSQELRIDAVCRSFEAAWQAAAEGGTRAEARHRACGQAGAVAMLAPARLRERA
jgi:hypothetical protein